MSGVTEEMVEAAIRASHATGTMDTYTCVRAALAAVVPGIVAAERERCAVVADIEEARLHALVPVNEWTRTDDNPAACPEEARRQIAEYIAAAIRTPPEDCA